MATDIFMVYYIYTPIYICVCAITGGREGGGTKRNIHTYTHKYTHIYIVCVITGGRGEGGRGTRTYTHSEVDLVQSLNRKSYHNFYHNFLSQMLSVQGSRGPKRFS